MRRIRKLLAVWLTVCMVCGTYGSNVLAFEMQTGLERADLAAGSDTGNDVKRPGEAEDKDAGEKVSDVEKEDFQEEPDEKEGGADGTENEDSEEETGESGSSDSEEEIGETGNNDSEEKTDEPDNSGSGEGIDESDSNDSEEETDESDDSDSGKEEDNTGSSFEETEVPAEEFVTVSENDLPRYNAAGTVAEDNFDYTIDSKTNTVTLNGYAKDFPGSTELYIPSTLGGYPVTVIKASAFAENTVLRSLVIPDSVTTIGGIAFA